MGNGEKSPASSQKADSGYNPSFPLAAENFSTTSATGIEGLDFILHGGLPLERPTLIRGGPGTGKTVIALTILCHGLENGEPGVLVTFDESPQTLIQHADALGLGLGKHFEQKRVMILDMRPARSDLVSGENLELTAVLTRISHALKQIGGQRLVIDAIDGMDDAFSEARISVRTELARVFDWLRECAITSVITVGERADFSHRYGVEDYVADCVVELKQEMRNRSMSRLLRVIKRRGGGYETNEFPFLMDREGVFVLPVTGTKLRSFVSTQQVSTGVPELDNMLGGNGPYQGATVMYSGQSGTGKTSFAAHFAAASFKRGENVLYVSFEEGDEELVRNQGSIGLDLTAGLGSRSGQGKLLLEPILAVELGWEEHLLRIMRLVQQHQPSVVVLDPISVFDYKLKEVSSKALMLRLLHMLKNRGVTTVLTELLSDDSSGVSSLDISSMIDVWVKLHRQERESRLYRLLTVVKARGLPTSDQVSQFIFSENGVQVQGVQ
ncbi:MAG: circadian clock protein KaiC [Desulfohalobiaceae bacterium]